MNKIFIGIDFSLKSPAICILRNGQYKWLSHCSKVDKPKSEVKIQEDVALLNDVTMNYQAKFVTGNNYSTSDYANFTNYREHAQQLANLIGEELKDISMEESSIHIGFEGFSFNSFSNSNNIIDIVAATTTFKNLLRDVIDSHIKTSAKFTIDIVAPIVLKQYAGYSKFDKVDMFDIFTGQYEFIKLKWADAISKDFEKKASKGKPSVFNLNYHDSKLKGSFYNYCCLHEINRSVKKPRVPKPIDDMIDAYFCCCWLAQNYSKV